MGEHSKHACWRKLFLFFFYNYYYKLTSRIPAATGSRMIHSFPQSIDSFGHSRSSLVIVRLCERKSSNFWLETVRPWEKILTRRGRYVFVLYQATVSVVIAHALWMLSRDGRQSRGVVRRVDVFSIFSVPSMPIDVLVVSISAVVRSRQRYPTSRRTARYLTHLVFGEDGRHQNRRTRITATVVASRER